jgi:hypothetical protein
MATRRENDDLTQDTNEALVLDNLDLNAEDLGLNENNDSTLDLDDGDDEGDLEQPQGKSVRFDDEGVDDSREVRRGEDRRELQHDQRVTHKLLPRAGEAHPDGRGNLVNAQGVIVARAGKEARLYQEAKTATSRAAVAEGATREITNRFNQLAGHARQLVDTVKQYEARDQQLQQFNLKPEEQLRAYQMFVELRDNAEVGLRKLLTRAAANGIDLTKLGVEGSSNTKAIVDLLRAELGQVVEPIKQRTALEQQQQQEQQRLTEVRTNAAKEVETFLAANPEAIEYLPVLQQLLANPQTRGMSLAHLWAEVRLNLLQNPQKQQRTHSRRMPSGRSAPVGALDGSSPRGGDELAPVDMSYDDIIRDLLKPEAA